MSDLGAGVEAADIAGEGAEVAAETGAAAGILSGGEEAAGTLALTPVPGARVLAAGVAVGAVIAAGIGALFGMNKIKEPQETYWNGIAGARQLSDKEIDALKAKVPAA